jgi:Ferritin-like
MTDNRASGAETWSLEHLHAHFQGAVDFEFWTIPYYLSAMYSIRDPASEAFRLIQSIVNEEMLHTQLACNLANAFGYSPKLSTPVYGSQIPHLEFDLDDPDPTTFFNPYSTEIGPLDQKRINTMCLIEYPHWRSRNPSAAQEDRTQYGSIADFYAAISAGVAALKDHIAGNVRQIDYFRHYYNNLTTTTITRSGSDGLSQATELLAAIVEQGEGQTRGDTDVSTAYRNTADGYQDSWPHFRKLTQIRDAQPFPDTYAANPEPGGAARQAQAILVRDFTNFIDHLNAMFRGERDRGFGVLMAKLGGDVLNCWQRGAVPRFS